MKISNLFSGFINWEKSGKILALGGRLAVVAFPATRRRGGDTQLQSTNMFYVYILNSLKNNRNYVGYTENLKQRISEHNAGKGGGYSSKNKPFKLIHYEAYLNKKDAAEAERFYKTGYGREILKGKLKNYLGKSNS